MTYKKFKLKQLIEILADIEHHCLPEEGIQWMQEGYNKDRKGYTEGFNACRSQFLKNLKNKIK